MANELLHIDKVFNCYDTLNAEELNNIVNLGNAIVDYINEHESSWEGGGSSGSDFNLETLQDRGVKIAKYWKNDGEVLYIYAPSGGSDSEEIGLTTLMAFGGFTDDTAANNAWGLIKRNLAYPPQGFSKTSNISLDDGQMLYMITAHLKGDDWVPIEDNEGNDYYWAKPVRLGSGSSTSETGTDDNSYNYIYCRTSGNSVTTPASDSEWVDIMLDIEDKISGYSTGENGVWGDHPFGVSESLPYEWQVGFKKNDQSNWIYYYGPICISHWGHNGLDGDGVEYIFCLLSASNTSAPTLNPPYLGRIGEESEETISGVYATDSDIHYQKDDFIPKDWHDAPQQVSEAYPKQYVSIRKMDNGKWKEFSTPKLWGVYASNGFLVTLDNDTIILDDDTGSDAIEHVSLTKVFLWDGINDVTLSNNYDTIKVSIECTGYQASLVPMLVTRVVNNDILGTTYLWGDEITIDKNNYLGFALTKPNNNSNPLSVGTGQVIYTIKGYNNNVKQIEASKTLTIQIIDINDGTAYLLLVTPNTLGVERVDSSSPYTLRSGNSSIVVTATAVSGTSVENIPIKNGINNVSNGEFYVVVSNSGGTSSGITLDDVSVDNKTLTYGLSGLLNLVTAVSYITVDLYYMYNNTGIKVDSETVDFSIKGDKGVPGTGQGTESYVITSNNDNAVIDDQTNNSGLIDGTAYSLTVYKGNTEVTNLCTYTIGEVSLPLQLSLYSYTILNGTFSTNEGPLSKNSVTTNNLNLFVLLKPSEYENDLIDSGNYYYDVIITHNDNGTINTVGTKRFKLYVDANISSDGSFCKLSIEGDTVPFNSDGDNLSGNNSKIVIKAFRYPGGTLLAISSITTNYSALESLQKTDGYFYVVILNSDGGNPIVSSSAYISGNNTNTEWYITKNQVQYSAEGYDVYLYKYEDSNLRLLDVEHIDCTKNGANGNDGNDGDDAVVYDLVPSPSVLKFNVDPTSPTNTLAPSSISFSCRGSYKKGTDAPILFINGTLNQPYSNYKIYFKIKKSDGFYKDLSNILGHNVNCPSTIQLEPSSVPLPATNTITNIGEDLTCTAIEYYLATGINSNGNFENTIKNISIPILRDGLKGESGSSSTGTVDRFYYFAGDWNEVPSEGLLVSDTRCPYVYYNGSYYMYIGEPSSTSPYIITKANLLGTNISDITASNNWEEMTYNKFAISEAMFANYAKLGAAIFNRDWMISLYGTVNGSTSINFSSFDPIKFMTEIKGEAEIGIIPSGASNTNKLVSQLFKLTSGIYTITITLSGELTTTGSIKLLRFSDTNLFTSNIESLTVNTGSEGNATVIGTYSDSSSTSNNITISVTPPSAGVYAILAVTNESIYSIKIVANSYSGTFIPNYALDLRSGFVYLNNSFIKGEFLSLDGKITMKSVPPKDYNSSTNYWYSKDGIFMEGNSSGNNSIELAKENGLSGYEPLTSTSIGTLTLKNYNGETLLGEVKISSNTSDQIEIKNGNNTTFSVDAGKVESSSWVKTPSLYTDEVSSKSGNCVKFPDNIKICTINETYTLPDSAAVGCFIIVSGGGGDCKVQVSDNNYHLNISGTSLTSTNIGSGNVLCLKTGTYEWKVMVFGN